MPCLFNIKLKEFKHVQMKVNAWKKVAETENIGTSMYAYFCESAWDCGGESLCALALIAIATLCCVRCVRCVECVAL